MAYLFNLTYSLVNFDLTIYVTMWIYMVDHGDLNNLDLTMIVIYSLRMSDLILVNHQKQVYNDRL